MYQFFTPCGEQITRGHSFKLRVQHCRSDARKYFFSLRVTTIRYQLPVEVCNAVTVAAFVAKLRSHNLSRYCYRLQIVYCRFGIDISVHAPVYTFACTYFFIYTTNSVVGYTQSPQYVTSLYPTALTSTNDQFSVLRHYVCT